MYGMDESMKICLIYDEPKQLKVNAPLFLPFRFLDFLLPTYSTYSTYLP